MQKHLTFAQACIRCGFYGQAQYHLRKALAAANIEKPAAKTHIFTALNLIRSHGVAS